MNYSVALAALALLSGCGRTGHNGNVPTEDNAAGAAAGGAESSAPAPGIGPIDASGQPDALPMTCEGRAESLAFKLPCLVGQNLSGQVDQLGYHVVECELAGMPDQTAVSFIVPLKRLPELLNRPVNIPFDDIPGPPPSSGVALDAEHFAGTLSGIVTFTQVDVDGRAFVAHLEQGRVGAETRAVALRAAHWMARSGPSQAGSSELVHAVAVDGAGVGALSLRSSNERQIT